MDFTQEDHNNINEETDKLTPFIIQAARNSIPLSNIDGVRKPRTMVEWRLYKLPQSKEKSRKIMQEKSHNSK